MQNESGVSNQYSSRRQRYIDREPLTINLQSGNYYSTEGVCSLVWHGIQPARTYPALVER
jgi:hypothetical protein